MEESTRDPEAMLARLRTEEPQALEKSASRRGRLKIFFGYAAGVGKTYTMLEAARVAVLNHRSVLLGYIEPHGRPETEALLLGHDLLPVKEIDYRGVKLREFDLDAALQRKPEVLVVDELAHTNAPGCRHTKRWQDVEELIDAGIDVWTTLNVQHLESLNDVVAKITGVVVRETIPDRVFDKADEIELVDLPPGELLDRFREGRVYVLEQAERASQQFFRKANLIALREVAMRRLADRVSHEVQTARLGHTRTQIWPTRERLLVCVGPSPTSAKVIRSARNLASSLNAEWIAVAVEEPASRRMTEEDRHRLNKNLELAESLGAETAVLSGYDVAEEILKYAGDRNVTKIVIGKPDRKRQLWGVSGTVVDRLLARSGDIDVYVVRGFGELTRVAPSERGGGATQPLQYLSAMGIILLATGLAMGLRRLGLSEANIVMTILMGVAVAAFWLGLGPAILASVAGVLLFNFFFAVPYHSLDVYNPGYLYTFAVMLATALGVSMLAHRVRHQARAARQTQRRTESLYQLSRRLVAAAGMADLIVAAQRQIGEVFDAEALVLLPDEANNVGVRFGGVPPFLLDSHELAAAQWVYEHAQAAGRGTETLPTVEGFYMPLLSQDGPVGVLALRLRGQRDRLPSDQRQLLETFAAQLAISIQRERLHEQARLIQIEMETERARSNLLSSVSHDLRTPLAVIAGTSSSLLDGSNHFDEQTRQELTETIQEESTRLSQLVENLLYMTRLESGATKVRKEWQPLDEVIGSAIARVRQSSPDADLQASIPSDSPQVPIDGVLIEQVLINLIDNAIRYGGPSGKIEIRATAGRSEAVVQVLDHGPGIPRGQERHIFEKFVRAGPSGANNRGAGLGLAICDAIVRAHGGRIEAFNRPEGGACLRFTLPIEGTPPSMGDSPFYEDKVTGGRQDA